MADLADVEKALVSTVIGAMYPYGNDVVNMVGVPLRICRGRPTNASLINDRSIGAINIGIYAVAEPSRNTTRWGVELTTVPLEPSLTVSASGNTATFFGAAATGDIAGVLVNNMAFLYQAQTGDSAALIAAALADAVRASTICWLSGTMITVPGAVDIIARVASLASTVEEYSRQEQGFEIAILAPTPMLRDSAAQMISQTMAQISFLDLADGTGGRLRCRSAVNVDGDQAASIYRRNIVYDVEFATVLATTTPTMLFGDLVWNGATYLA